MPCVVNAVKAGDVCHVEADYYWSGIWITYRNDQLICDYRTINDLIFDNNEEMTEDEYQTDTEISDVPDTDREENYAGELESAPVADNQDTEADEYNSLHY